MFYCKTYNALRREVYYLIQSYDAGCGLLVGSSFRMFRHKDHKNNQGKLDHQTGKLVHLAALQLQADQDTLWSWGSGLVLVLLHDGGGDEFRICDILQKVPHTNSRVYVVGYLIGLVKVE